MRIKILSIFFFLTLSLLTQAQFPGFGGKRGPSIKGTIKGELIDTSSNQVIGFATISLRKAGSDKIIDGVLSEEDGSFKLKEVVNGKYDIAISFLGFEERIFQNVEVTLKEPTADLGKLFLFPSNFVLDEIEIKETRMLIENQVDKVVFNAEEDASIAGGDATDVLRKVPMLSVDLDGNVSLRGSQNVKILINGKPSGMFSSNVAEALKMFPADEIKKVEVITSPGAKYDGEGSGGIINIITKKKNVEGIAGSVNASAGTRQNSLFLNLNAGRGRFGLSSNGSLFYSVPQDASTSWFRQDETSAGTRIIEQDGIQNTSRLGFRGAVSAFYDFNAYNSLNTSINYRGTSFDRDGFTDAMFDDPVSGFSDVYRRDDLTETIFSGYDWNTDYTMKFENDDVRELSMAVQVSGEIQNQDYELSETHLLDVLNRQENIFNDGNNLEITSQIDYVHPTGSSSKLEVGVKSVIRNIDSDYQYEVFNPELNQFNLDEGRSNIFLYDQDVYASYASYNYKLGKFNLISGLRYEHTTIHGDYQNGETPFKNNYDNLLPNFAISRPLSNFRNLKLSYSKRIQRPSLFYINPFNNSVDLINQSVGNPLLKPEITHQIEMAYNFRFLGFSVFGATYYKLTKDIIESVLDINELGLSITSFENVGENNSFGVNLFTSKSIGRFSIRLGGDVFTYNAKGIVNGIELNNQAVNYRIFTNGDYAITGNLKMDFFGFFNSPRRTLQGNSASFSIFGFGIRQDWKNVSLGIRVIEPFSSHKAFNTDLKGEGFIQRSSFRLPFRSVGINLRYKFGKVDFKERKSKIQNTDLKQGEGGNQGQGTTGGGTSGQSGK